MTDQARPFYYFAEGRPAIGAAALAELGLADRFEAPPATRECSAGPGGRPGICFAQLPDGMSPADLGHFPARQTWTAAAGTPGLWIGYETAAPPSPEVLARRHQIDGYWVDLAGLAGDARWIIPLARIYPEGTKFPEALAIGPDGRMVRHGLPRYADACRLAERLAALLEWSNLTGDDADDADKNAAAGLEMSDVEEFQAAAQILAINYRVGPDELGILRAITTENLTRILFLFVDVPSYLAIARDRAADDAAKKNETDPTPPE